MFWSQRTRSLAAFRGQKPRFGRSGATEATEEEKPRSSSRPCRAWRDQCPPVHAWRQEGADEVLVRAASCRTSACAVSELGRRYSSYLRGGATPPDGAPEGWPWLANESTPRFAREAMRSDGIRGEVAASSRRRATERCMADWGRASRANLRHHHRRGAFQPGRPDITGNEHRARRQRRRKRGVFVD